MAGYGDLVTRVIERVPLVAQELLTFPEDPSSHPDDRVVHSLVFYVKNRQRNGQRKTYKRTNNDLQNIHIKLKI
jgi:hypothetical protein